MIAVVDNEVLGPVRATSCEPLLEAEVEGTTQQDVNALPPLEGEWKSLDYRRKAAAKLLSCVCVMIGPLFALMPATVDLTYDVVCSSIGVPLDQCATSDFANETIAHFFAYENIFSCGLMLLMVPLVTGICQRYGYKANFAWSGTMISMMLLSFYVNCFVLSSNWSYWWLLVGDLFQALAGGFVVTSNVLLLAQIQLFPEPELRPRYISISTGIMGLVGTISPSLGSYFARLYGVKNLLLLCAGLSGTSALFASVMTGIPEYQFAGSARTTVTDASEAPKKGNWAKARAYAREQLSSLHILSFSHITDKATRVTAFVLLFNQVSNTELAQGGSSALFMFSKQYLGWSSDIFGLILTIITASATFWGLCGFPFLQTWLSKYYAVNPSGVDQLDYRFLLWGNVVRLLGFSGISAAQTSSQMLAAIAFRAQAALQGPTFTTSLVKIIPASDGTALMTALALLDTVCGIFVPTLMMQIYKATLNWWPRLIFELETLITGIQLLALIFLVKVVAYGQPNQV